MELKGSQLEQLSEALRSAFRTRERLQQMLKFKLERDLNDITLARSMRDVVFDLMQAAEADGWTEALLTGARADNPNNPRLRAFAKTVNVAHEPPPLLAFELAHPSSFDLSDVDKVYWDTIAPSPEVAAKRRVIGFAVRYFDKWYLTNVCARILRNAGASETHQTEWLTLESEFNGVSHALTLLGSHKKEFSKKHLLCPIRAEYAETTVVKEFWEKVHKEFKQEYKKGLPNNLLILFTGKEGSPFPTGVVEIPRPRFEFSHLLAWTHATINLLQWPTYLAHRWSSLLFDRSSGGDPPSLGISNVYVNLLYDIEMLQINPSGLRALLEKKGEPLPAPTTLSG